MYPWTKDEQVMVIIVVSVSLTFMLKFRNKASIQITWQKMKPQLCPVLPLIHRLPEGLH